MEHDTMYLGENPTFTYKISRQKGAVAACAAIVFLAYLLFLVSAWWLNESVAMTAMPVLFLVAGILHLAVLNKSLPVLTPSEKWIFTACLTIAVLMLLSISSLWHDQLFWSRVLAGAGAFLLPFVLYELLQLHLLISYSGALPWQAKPGPAVDFPSIYLNGIPVRFRILEEPSENNVGTIEFLASGRMLLGDVFCDMLQKQTKKGLPSVSLLSPEQEPYTWIFFTDDLLFWNRALDPNSSLLKNRVRKNATIYAQRVLDKTFSIHTQKIRKQNPVS